MQKSKHIITKISSIITLICADILYAGVAHACVYPLVDASGVSNGKVATGCVYNIIPLATLPNLAQSGQPIAPTAYIQGIYGFAIAIGVVIAVVSGVVAGVEYMLSESSITNKSKAIERIKNVGWGAALLLSSYLLLQIINPELVNWNLNLGIINTTNLTADINANNAAQQAVVASQNIANSAASANSSAQAAVTSAQTALTTAQAWLDNLAGDSDPTGQCDNDVEYANAYQDICGPIAEAEAAVETAQANLTQATTEAQATEATFLQASANSVVTNANSALATDLAAATSDAAQCSHANGTDPATGNNFQSETGSWDDTSTVCGNQKLTVNAAYQSIINTDTALSVAAEKATSQGQTVVAQQITNQKAAFDARVQANPTLKEIAANKGFNH